MDEISKIISEEVGFVFQEIEILFKQQEQHILELEEKIKILTKLIPEEFLQYAIQVDTSKKDIKIKKG